MGDRLTVVPAELHRAADEHRAAAERLRAIGTGNAQIMATLNSLGPVFADLRDAGQALLDERRASYEQQATAHGELARRLTEAAAAWEEQDADAAQRLRDIGGGAR
ncbi:MAG: ESX-1 secretion-associated protein [Mycobacterium sp.]|nr:ESX-1 secretion-associated protein [Mycobacterium sp.]